MGQLETKVRLLEKTLMGDCPHCSSEFEVIIGSDGSAGEDAPLVCEECGRNLLVDIGGPLPHEPLRAA